MKNLETLIQELCPDGVEFVMFKDCCDYIRGITYNKSKEENNSDAPAWKVLRANNITLSNNQLNFNDVKRVSIEVKVKESQKLKKGDILICAGSGSKDHIGKVAYIEDNVDYTFGGFMAVIRSTSVNTRFLFHILTGSSFKQYLSLALNSSTINNLNSSVMGNFEFPLPPIEVQTEIVRILDKFTSLEAELEAELDCRKRQYEYYRDKLLSFDNVGGQEVEWKKMSEVSFYPKTRIDASELSDNSYIGVENLLKYKLGRTDSTVKPEGSVIQFVEKDILIGNIRPYLRKIWKSDCKGGTNGDVLCIRVKEPSEVSADYLFHILSSEKFFLYDIKNSKGAKMPHGDKSAVMDFEIPIPSLDEQNRIVSILDRFESLTTSLQSGLPAEISARRQQYEYYRDKLLTFKRKGAA